MVRFLELFRVWIMNTDEPAPPPPGPEKTAMERASTWERVTDLLAAALERPAAERRGWLSGLTEIDEALRSEVASLLDASEKAGDFLKPGEIPLPDFRDLPDSGDR